ncbi:MAG: hypothetical protein AABY27_05505 [Pseudomonadota bacterium]
MFIVEEYDVRYEELKRKKDDPVVQKIIKEIFGFKNLIFTSKLDALPLNEKNKFQRIIETKGLSLNGVKEFIVKYFENQKTVSMHNQVSRELLLRILDDPQVNQLTRNPINLSMLCLVCSNSDAGKILAENFTIGKLYKFFVIWLAKRYVPEFRDATEQEIFTSKEFAALSEIALEALKENNVISGEKAQKIVLKYQLNLKNIYKIGFLKSANPLTHIDNERLADYSYRFGHITTQDYLAAYTLAKQLMSGDKDISSKAAYFVAEHRNFDSFLPLLKTTAELLSQIQDGEDPTPIQRFWEAATCNVDGVLEIGADEKVALLMHLLPQALVNGDFDSRIPNLEVIKNFIEMHVLKDILEWKKELKTSGYFSNEMKTEIENLINSNWNNGGMSVYKVNSLLSIVYCNINKFNKKEILDKLVSKLKDELSWQTKRPILTIIPYILGKVKYELSLKDKTSILRGVFPLVLDINLNKEASSIVISLLSLIDDSDLFETIIDDIFEIANDNIIIAQILVYISSRLNEDKLRSLIKKLGLDNIISFQNSHENYSKFLTLLYLNKGEKIIDLTLVSLIKLIEENSNSNEAFNVIAYLLNESDIRLVNYILKFLEPKLQNAPTYLLSLLSYTRSDADAEITNTISNQLIEKLLQDEINAEATVKAILALADKSIEINAEKRKQLILKLIELKTFSSPLLIALVISNESGKIGEILDWLSVLLAVDEYNDKIVKVISEVIKFSSEDLKNLFINKLSTILHFDDTNENTKIRIFNSLFQISGEDFIISVLTDPFVDLLLSILTNNNSNNHDVVIELICKITCDSKQLQIIFHKKLVELLGFVQGSNLISTSRIIEAISRISQGITNDYDDRIFDVLIAKLVLKQANARAVAHAIGNLVEGNSILTGKAIAVLLDGAKKEDEVSADAIYALGKIVKKQNIVIGNYQEILDVLVPLLKSGNLQILSSSVYTISKILLKKHILQDHTTLLQSMIDTLPQLENDKKSYSIAINSISKLVKNYDINEDMIYPVVTDVTKYLLTLDNSSELDNALSIIFHEMSIIKLVEYLQNDDRIIRKIAIRTLTEKESYGEKWEEEIESILKILASDDSDSELNLKKDLVKKVKERLQILIANTDDTYLEWINDNFKKLNDISETKARMLMEILYHQALKDKVITAVEVRFILSCIVKYNFANVITRPELNSKGEIAFTILFKGILYHFIGEKNLTHLEIIASTILLNSKDGLARQFISYKALFKNEGSGIKIASTDLPCNSLVDGKELSSTTTRVSICYLSDQRESIPEDFFILVERRVLGRYVVDRLSYLDGGAISRAQIESHPDEINLNQKRKIFGGMEYDIKQLKKARYFIYTIELSHAALEKILALEDFIIANNRFTPSPVQGNDSDDEAVLTRPATNVRQIMQPGRLRMIDEEEKEEEEVHQSHDTSVTSGLSRMRQYMPSNLNPFNRERTSSSDDKRTISKMRSIIFGQVGNVNAMNSPVAKIYKEENSKRLVSLLKEAIKEAKDVNIALTGDLTHDIIFCVQYTRAQLLGAHERRDSQDIDILELRSGLQEVQKQLKNINIEVLEAVIDKEKLHQNDRAEVIQIEADEYKASLYNAIIWQLNSVYIATSAISTGMVKNEGQDIAGKIGGLLTTIGKHTPLAGIGLTIVGQIFDGVNDFNQGKKVKNYVKLARDSNVMSKVAEKIARKFALSNMEITEVMTISDGIEATIDAVNNAKSISVASIVTNALEEITSRVQNIQDDVVAGNKVKGLKDYASRFIKNSQEDSQSSKGEKDAGIIARLIVKMIFEGKIEFGSARRSEEKAQIIFDSINAKMNQGSSSSSAVPTTVLVVDTTCTKPRCIIMNARLVFDNPLLNSPRLLELYNKGINANKLVDLSKEDAKKLLLEIEIDGIDKVANKLLFAEFLTKAKAYLDKDEIDKLVKLGEDNEIVEQILSSSNSLGVEKVLEIIFDINNSDILIEKIGQFRKLVESSELNEKMGFELLISKILSNNYLSSFSKQVMQSALNLNEYLEKLLDHSVNPNKIAIAIAQLEFLLDYAASGHTKTIPFYRPPHFDPGDGNGGGSDHYSSGSNSSNAATIVLPMGLSFNTSLMYTDI